MEQDIELLRKMRRCGHLLYHRYSFNQSQNRILLLLHRKGPMTQKDLLEQMHIQPGSLSEVVSKVENCGLIERKRAERDRRVWELQLTEKGRNQAITFEQQRETMAEKLFSVLTPEQKEEFGEILSTLLQNWDTPCDTCRSNTSQGTSQNQYS